MPPKSKRQNQQRSNDDEGEEPFQAVILTDSYDEQFLPISHEIPRCLMPLCNVPLIEYTLEVLAVADVAEVFVVCTSHIDQIKEYFDNSTWCSPHSPMSVQVIQAPEAMSVGDAIRELDARQLITTDFILTFGDLVSNLKLNKILEEHRARRRADKNSIMTMVLKEASRTHSSRAKDKSSVFVTDPKNNQCLFYETVDALPRKSRIEMSPEVFENHAQIEIRNDLVDPYLDICSVEVPALFTENFDWQRLRADFVHGILTSDILGKTIYTHCVSEPYVARIQNEQLYSTVSNHLLNRWAFPIVPETNLRENDDYLFMRGNIYKASNVILSRSCVIDENVQIGSGTIIGENSRVANSVIGKNCIIGDNVLLEGAYIWDNVTISNNCVISKSIIASGASIRENSSIQVGCLVSPEVTVGPEEHIPKYSRLSLHPQPKNSMFADDSDDEEEASEHVTVLKSDSHPDIYFWTECTNDDDDVDIRNVKIGTLAFDMADLKIGSEELSESASEIGEESDEESDDDNIGSIGGAFEAQDAVKSAEFQREIAQTLERAFSENHTVDTAALEITGLRMSHNGSYDQVREVLIPALLDHVDLTKDAVKNLQAVLKKWCPLIRKVTHGFDDQVHVLYVFQKHSSTNETLSKLFVGILQLLYNEDVVEEDSVFRWYASDISKNGTPSEVKLREKATKFIDWLREADEESSEEEDDEEEDSDEE